MNQIIILYTLNLYNVICQICLNKGRRKKKENRKVEVRTGNIESCFKELYGIGHQKYGVILEGGCRLKEEEVY